MEFVAEMYSCASCGQHADVAWRVTDRGDVWPSAILDRDALTRELARVTPNVPEEPELHELEPIRMAALRTGLALAELEKLAPDQRAEIAVRRQHWRTIAENADVLLDVEEGAKEAGTPRDALGPPAMAAHRDWLERGRSGQGRLDLRGFVAAGARFPDGVFAGARLSFVDLR
jgi:hypothetical protein